MIVIVIGMHRSGTSALAGVLHKNKIIMGEEHNFIPKPSSENPKGFFENYQFRRLNDQIIEKNGYKIKSWDTNIPKDIKVGIIDRYKMKKLIKKYNSKHKDWGWKDPRTCLTLKIWLDEIKKLDLINECKIIYINRNIENVAKSMVKRGNTNYNNALLLCKEYNNRATQAIKLYKPQVLYLNYEELISIPIKISQLMSNFLKIFLDKNTIKKFIDKNLNHHA